MKPNESSIEKVLNAAFRLNAEAYEHQVLSCAKKGRLKQFTPCEKAEMLMRVVREGTHFGQAHVNAVATLCTCHPDLTDAKLMTYEYDRTFRDAHYRGDSKTLSPRLYGKQA